MLQKKGIRKIKGIEYAELFNGVLLPLSFVAEKQSIKTPEQMYPYLLDLCDTLQEHFVVLTLDGHHQVIKRHIVTIGLLNQSQIHPRECFRPALLDAACSIVLAHNHPSGNLNASDADLNATKRLVEAGKMLGVPILDHLIFSKTGFSSLRATFPHYF